MRKRKKKTTGRKLVQAGREIRERARKKRVILPGPWSETGVEEAVPPPRLVATDTEIPSWGSVYGKYLLHDDNYLGDGFRVLLKVTFDDFSRYVEKWGIDKTLAAIEVAFNSGSSRNKLLGDFVFLRYYNTIEEILRRGYVICQGKTNKKHISGFLGEKRGLLQVF